MTFSHGYSMEVGALNMDGLGKLYISIAVAWTFMLIPGAIILYRNRQLPYLRIRNVPLALSSVMTLHVYLCLCFLVYVLKGNFPCQTEFWVMSIYLPLGIALYQASNTQLLHISALQKKFTLPEKSDDKKPTVTRGWRHSMEIVMSYNPTQRTLTFIAVGMVVQFVCALTVFLISQKFNSFGTVGHPVPDSDPGRVECRKGWEWWPSVAWQLGWTWLYAPYLLWKVSGIKDVHGWRIQTLVCCLAGLPASPLWLCALYVKKMQHTVSLRWTPPLWFAPSIMLMQGFAIFGPCVLVYKNRRLENETRQIIAEWEHKKKYGTSLSSDSTKAVSKSKYSLTSLRSTRSSTSARSGEMYTMASLEKALQVNPKPLLLFAALKDFSGENISFLNHVSEWKEIWIPASSPKPGFMRKADPDTRDQEKLRREQFTLAVHIYSAFISMQYSDFPINISSVHFKRLQDLFDSAAQKINGASKHNSATPFDVPLVNKQVDDLESSLIKDQISITTTAVGSTEDIFASPERKHYSQLQAFKLSNMREKLPSDVVVPASFGPDSFDEAEKHIKGLILTNTWPKFVNAGHANNMDKISFKERLDSCVADLGDLWRRRIPRKSPVGEA